MIATTQETPASPVAAKRRIFLVDDHPIFRLGLTRLIDQDSEFEVCGQAESAPQALGALRQTEADAVVINVSLPGTNGLELVKQLRAEHPALPILMLSVHDEQTYALRCLRAGASGYLMKTGNDQLFVTALRKIVAGGVYVSPAFGEQLIYKVASSKEQGTQSPLQALTDRELEILQHVGTGRSSREIAEALHLSVKTVESHRLHIKEKLGLGDAGKLVRFATEWVSEQHP